MADRAPDSTPRSSWPRSRPLWPHVATLAAVCLCALNAAIYAFRLPLGAGPDEPHHVAYVDAMLRSHSLPLSPGFAPPGQEWRECEQTQHPPLYYALLVPVRAAVAGLPDGVGQRAIRLASLCMVLIALLCIWAAARRLWPQSPWRAAVAVGFAALLPQTQYMGSVVNNSSGALLAGAAGVLLCARLISAPSVRGRDWLLLGLVSACALGMKLTGVWVVWLTLACGIACARRSGAGWGRISLGLAIYCLPIAALMLPWFAHNYLTYGEPFPVRVTGRPLFAEGPPDALTILVFAIDIGIRLSPTTMISFFSPYWLLRTHFAPVPAVLVTSIWFLPALIAALARFGSRRRAIRGRGWDMRSAFWLVLAGAALLSLGSVAALGVVDFMVLAAPGRYVWEACSVVALLWAAAMMSIPWRAARRGLTTALLVAEAAAGSWICGWVLVFSGVA